MSSYYLLASGIIAIALFLVIGYFDKGARNGRQAVILAVMIGLVVAGRAAFFMVPQFKPVAALIIITGASLGARNGFLVGVLSAFLSNFIFGQGPWTPWQMLGFGIIGALAGLFAPRQASPGKLEMLSLGGGGEAVTVGGEAGSHSVGGTAGRVGGEGGRVGGEGGIVGGGAILVDSRLQLAMSQVSNRRNWLIGLCVFGSVITFLVYGLVMDTAAVAMFSGTISVELLISSYLVGLPFNLIHTGSTAIFLALLAIPLTEKLERVKTKFGLFR